eukprot:scaffold18261_cov141-Skeletonema_marinoi.AAC.6
MEQLERCSYAYISSDWPELLHQLTWSLSPILIKTSVADVYVNIQTLTTDSHPIVSYPDLANYHSYLWSLPSVQSVQVATPVPLRHKRYPRFLNYMSYSRFETKGCDGGTEKLRLTLSK